MSKISDRADQADQADQAHERVIKMNDSQQRLWCYTTFTLPHCLEKERGCQAQRKSNRLHRPPTPFFETLVKTTFGHRIWKKKQWNVWRFRIRLVFRMFTSNKLLSILSNFSLPQQWSQDIHLHHENIWKPSKHIEATKEGATATIRNSEIRFWRTLQYVSICHTSQHHSTSSNKSQ